MMGIADSPLESSLVFSIADIVQYIGKSTGVHWNPLEFTGVHVDSVGEFKVLRSTMHSGHLSNLPLGQSLHLMIPGTFLQ